MKLSFHEKNGVVILEPRGKIMGGPDATVLHDKLHDLIAEKKLKVVIDLSEVDWMNSTSFARSSSFASSIGNPSNT